MRTRHALATTVILALLAPEAAVADKKSDTLNIGWSNSLPSYDLYFNQSVAEGQMIGRLIWDHLIERNLDRGSYSPVLATAWRWVNPEVLEFDLRQGVKFHDGADFTADDVVFTVNWVSNPDNKVNIQNMVNWMRNAEKVDTYKVRINLKKPFPAALEYVASTLAIYPREYYAKAGPKGMSDKPVGSGPYKVTEAVAGKTITLVRNDQYFSGGAKAKPTIGKIVQRTIGETQTQVAELISGRLDWIWQVPPDLAKNLATRKDIKVVTGESMRLSYLTLAAEGHLRPYLPGDPADLGQLPPDPVRMHPGGHDLRLRSGQGEAPPGRSRLPERLRGRALRLSRPAGDRGDHRRSPRRRHRRQAGLHDLPGHVREEAAEGDAAGPFDDRLLVDRGRVRAAQRHLPGRAAGHGPGRRTDRLGRRGRQPDRPGEAPPALPDRLPAHH
jgi:hypothetical protein